MKIDTNQWKWTRKPKDFTISEDKIEVITNPHTDLWQRTYYHFRNDNAPVLQIKTSKKMFSFYCKDRNLKLRYALTSVVLLCISIVKTG